MSDLINYYEAATQQASASDLPSNEPVPRLHPGAALTFSHCIFIGQPMGLPCPIRSACFDHPQETKFTWSRHAKFVILKKCWQ